MFPWLHDLVWRTWCEPLHSEGGRWEAGLLNTRPFLQHFPCTLLLPVRPNSYMAECDQLVESTGGALRPCSQRSPSPSAESRRRVAVLYAARHSRISFLKGVREYLAFFFLEWQIKFSSFFSFWKMWREAFVDSSY